MGQQQLLLLVLGIVIVGLAVVVGIQAFSENQKKANADAMVTDALRIASDCQVWDLKPGQFGGSLATEDLSDCTFDEIGFTNTSGTYTNVNADYTLPTSLPSGCSAPTIPSGVPRSFTSTGTTHRRAMTCVSGLPVRKPMT